MPDVRTKTVRPSWWRRAIGEINALRQQMWSVSDFTVPYTLDSSRVDYHLARDLYRNTREQYKLGAAFAKPIINTTAGFMGVPHFSHDDPDADQALEEHFTRWRGKLLRAVRNALRDGDVFVQLARYPDKFSRQPRFQLQLIPPEWVTPVLDPITGEWAQVVIRHPVTIRDTDGRVTSEYVVDETWTPEQHIITADSRAPAEVKARDRAENNPWGFIPIIHFKNEAEEYQMYGVSELEAVEPYLRAYHDVMLFAVQGSQMFSRPKVKFKLKDVRKFLADNFSQDEVKSGRINFSGREIFFLQDGEDAEFITADSGLAGVTTLLKFLYFCIVDVTETPEFAFGTAVQSSKASVSEQMVPLMRKIHRKRGQFEEPFGELASMFLAMWAKVENRALDSYDAHIEWDEVSPQDDAEVATTINTLINGLSTGVEAGLVSMDAAAELLRDFVPQMLPWVDPEADEDERRRVARSFALVQRLRDGEGIDDLSVNPSGAQGQTGANPAAPGDAG
ncbi:phage portal protein [Alicyclobacillus kakegawensis]|uniref:phage portal protein n=1 Tax=Alicyclobacillus kakegawensis TaxID=392012 RepID=UPI00082ADB4A|nr:phage portal protein [Alicyclobacillus kakegawensis]